MPVNQKAENHKNLQSRIPIGIVRVTGLLSKRIKVAFLILLSSQQLNLLKRKLKGLVFVAELKNE